MKASETFNRALNGIPSGNLKRYDKNILIKAKNKIQGKLLLGFRSPSESNIGSVTPHRSFNFAKGVIYSKDLYELKEHEILQRSPPSIYEVKKLKGNNNVILFSFSTDYLPDYVNFGQHVRYRVRRFRPNPKQCRKCLEYGHLNDACTREERCTRCSKLHGQNTECIEEQFCFLCDGNHSPLSNDCQRKKLEREIIETADVQRISIGSAKRQIMGANRSENSSYVNAIKKMKTSKPAIPRKANNSRNNVKQTTFSKTQSLEGNSKNNKEDRINPAKCLNSISEISLVDPESHNNETGRNSMDLELPDLGEPSQVAKDPNRDISIETVSSIITVKKKPDNDEHDSSETKKRLKTRDPRELQENKVCLSGATPKASSSGSTSKTYRHPQKLARPKISRCSDGKVAKSKPSRCSDGKVAKNKPSSNVFQSDKSSRSQNGKIGNCNQL